MSKSRQRSRPSHLTISREARKAAFDKNRPLDDIIELESAEVKPGDSDEINKNSDRMDKCMVEDVGSSNQMGHGE